jgi:hypothetical protein
MEDLYCRYLANSKKDMLEYVKEHRKNPLDYGYIESINELDIREIKYN